MTGPSPDREGRAGEVGRQRPDMGLGPQRLTLCRWFSLRPRRAARAVLPRLWLSRRETPWSLNERGHDQHRSANREVNRTGAAAGVAAECAPGAPRARIAQCRGEGVVGCVVEIDSAVALSNKKARALNGNPASQHKPSGAAASAAENERGCAKPARGWQRAGSRYVAGV